MVIERWRHMPEHYTASEERYDAGEPRYVMLPPAALNGQRNMACKSVNMMSERPLITLRRRHWLEKRDERYSRYDSHDEYARAAFGRRHHRRCLINGAGGGPLSRSQCSSE